MARGRGRPPHLLPHPAGRARPPAGGDASSSADAEGARLMGRFILRRLGFMVLTVILASIIIFWATTVLPGDVATMVLGRYATEQAKDGAAPRARSRQADRRAVRDVAGQLRARRLGALRRAPTTVVRSGRVRAAAQLAHARRRRLRHVRAARHPPGADRRLAQEHLGGQPDLGGVAGLHRPARVRQRHHPHHDLRASSCGWLPAQSAIDPHSSFVEAFPYLILPAITVALTSLAYVVRMTRSSTVDVLQMDYVRTANLKGLPPRRVLFTHVLRNSLLPTITVVAIGIGWLIGGLIVTESVFGYPGIGRLLLFAIQRRDLQLIQATALLHRHHLRRRQPGRRHPLRGPQPAHPLQLRLGGARRAQAPRARTACPAWRPSPRLRVKTSPAHWTAYRSP